MKTYEFVLRLAEDPRDLLEWSNALYDAGGDDSSPGETDGQAFAKFHRDAETLEQAIRSARETVQAAGLRVVQCEIADETISVW